MTRRALTAPDTTVRLSGPLGLAAAVPQLLGFEPERSLVLLCLRAPRGRVGPVARVDLFPPDLAYPVEQLVACADRHADAVALVCYHDGERPACVDAVLAGLLEVNMPVTHVLSVRDGTIRDAGTRARFRSDPGVPAPGTDDPQRSTLAAAVAMSGRRVLPDRESLRASIAAPRGRRLARARAEIDRVCAVMAAEIDHDPAACAPGRLADRADAAFAAALAEHAASGGVSLPVAAELIVLSCDITARDRLVARAAGHGDRDVVALLIAVAAWCPDEDAAEICAVLAVAAYRYGDGALAHCAIDRVLTIRPDHRLAHLTLAIMAACLPPDDLAAMADIAPGPLHDGDEIGGDDTAIDADPDDGRPWR